MDKTVIIVAEKSKCPKCGSTNLRLSDQRGFKGLLDWSILVIWEGVYLVCNDCGWRKMVHR